MQWPENVLPGSLPNFETQARLKRYRLLAQAAVRTGIYSLCLGHHQDDQIETILMRLVRGKSGSLAGFWGMAAEAPIPADAEIESELVHLWCSTSEEHLASGIGRSKTQAPVGDHRLSLPYSITVNSLHGRISPAWRLDVSLHRPLLGVSKARILATCKTNNIPFVSDATNFDPQSTLRNAVRYLLANYKLPRALNRDSILKVHDGALNRLNHVKLGVQRFLDVAQLTSFDLRSGSLTMRVPAFPHLLEWQDLETPVSFLVQVLGLVSPIDEYEMSKSSQQTAASFIFPDLSLPVHDSSGSAPVTTLAVNQVLMTREDQGDHSAQPYYVSWRLSRQPFKREQIYRLSRMFVHLPNPEHNGATGFWSDWIFWDCRYWIRICCTSVHYLQNCAIRPFQSSDTADLRTSLDRESRETLTSLLHDAAPGKVRYTLPVITDDMGIRAFPTLDFTVPGHERGGIGNKESKPGLLSWKVKYKYIDRKTIDRLIVNESLTDKYRADAEKYLKDQT
jgi:tRNA(Ile)-lysidine synthase